jgi:hypothetical protein
VSEGFGCVTGEPKAAAPNRMGDGEELNQGKVLLKYKNVTKTKKM